MLMNAMTVQLLRVRQHLMNSKVLLVELLASNLRIGKLLASLTRYQPNLTYKTSAFHDETCIVKSLTSEETPSATQFFKRPYIISNNPGL